MKNNPFKTVISIICIFVVFSFTSCASASSDVQVEVLKNEVSAAEGNRVYFAAPLFSQSEKDYNLRLAAVLEEYGYEVFLPQRDGIKAALLEGKTEEELIRIIFEKDIGEIIKSDIVFMVLDGRVPDEGACVELGYAYAIGKRCYGAKTDTRTAEQSLDLNPMISGCFVRIFKDYSGDVLIQQLRDYLSVNEL